MDAKDEAERYILAEASNTDDSYAKAARIMRALLITISLLESDVEALTLLSVKGAEVLIKEGKVPLST